MSYPLALSKAQTQASPYLWIWTTKDGRSKAGKYIGTSMIWVEGTDDTEVLRKINAHEGERAAFGKTPH